MGYSGNRPERPRWRDAPAPPGSGWTAAGRASSPSPLEGDSRQILKRPTLSYESPTTKIRADIAVQNFQNALSGGKLIAEPVPTESLRSDAER